MNFLILFCIVLFSFLSSVFSLVPVSDFSSLSSSPGPCSLNGVDYSGLSLIEDLSFTIENPCGFPTGVFDYYVSFCRPVNSSESCQALGASACAVARATGAVTVLATFPDHTIIKPLNGNSSLGLTLQGSSAEEKAFFNVFCSAAQVPGAPRAEFSPWVPTFYRQTIENSVNKDGECTNIEVGIAVSCVCPGSNGCAHPLPSFPVKAKILSVDPVEMACPGPKGSIFTANNYNLTVYQTFPNGQGFSSKALAKSKHFFTTSACAWSDNEQALFVGIMVYNATGSLILRVTQDSVEEFLWLSDQAIIESIQIVQDSLFLTYSSNNFTDTSSIWEFSTKPGASHRLIKQYYNQQMTGFGNFYITGKPGNLTIYASSGTGIWEMSLETMKFQYFSNNGVFAVVSRVGNVYVLTMDSWIPGGPGTQYPNCYINQMNPSNGELTLLLTIAECATVDNTQFFIDSLDQMWITNWGILLKVDIQL